MGFRFCPHPPYPPLLLLGEGGKCLASLGNAETTGTAYSPFSQNWERGVAGVGAAFPLLPIIAISLLLTTGCRPIVTATTAATPITTPAAQVKFTEIATEAGISFKHVNGAYGRKLMPETVGSGLAFADFDNDGKPDLLIVNGTNWAGQKTPAGSSKLYRNLGNGKFEDITKGSGVERPLYGMGVAVADYDGDGDQDVYLTAVGPNRLLRNDGNFHFTDVTKEAGVTGIPTGTIPLAYKWSSTAAWLDYDKDGDLDLFVCQYVTWKPEIDPFCGHNGVRGYCPPDNFEGARCTLFQNDGGTFKDVSQAVGLFDCAVGKSFGVGIDDFNQDGWPDIAVSNDTWANFLFINEGGKRFAEKGLEAGIAVATNGKARAGMGIDVADISNNGRACIVIGNFADEGLSLFEQDAQDSRELLFTDRAPVLGITAPSLLNVTFATFFLDVDLDGWPDLFATNGHVDDVVSTYKSMLTFEQLPLLFRNQQGKVFEDITKSAGLTEKMVGRGAAYADIDGDGDLDIGVVDNGRRFRLFRNDTTGTGHWLRLKLVGTGKNTDALGAQVQVQASGLTQRRYLKSGGSFLSESERVLTFGLGTATRAEKIIITWPDGHTQEFGPLETGQTHTLRNSGDKS